VGQGHDQEYKTIFGYFMDIGIVY